MAHLTGEVIRPIASTVAAVGFAGLLVVILKSGEVQAILTGLVRTALSVGG